MSFDIGSSGAARAFLGGQAAHLENLIEEENEEKIGENDRRMSKHEEMFLSCPCKVESLATPLISRGSTTPACALFVPQAVIPSVFPSRFLSLGQFYQIGQNWRVSCAKIINLKSG